MHFHARNALEVGRHEVERHHPFMKGDVTVLHNRVRLHAKILLAIRASVGQRFSGFGLVGIRLLTIWAFSFVSPKGIFKPLTGRLFIREHLEQKLPWDEFNRVPVAGVTNIGRLSQMLNDAAIGFLVMTAEDEHSDGTTHARENVVHEAGLFQGKLGFSKAIILLEEGCKEFSNIEGLGQIRFPSGNIKAAFEEVREVLEREDLLGTK